MSLYHRLACDCEDSHKIPVHQFMAAVSERGRGVLDREDLIAMFDLEIADHTELDDILDKHDSLATARKFEFARMIHDITLLNEEELHYTTANEFFSRVADFS